MKHNLIQVIFLPLLLIAVFVLGLGFWYLNFDSGLSPKGLFIISLAILLLIFPAYRIIPRSRDLKKNVPFRGLNDSYA